MTISDFLPVMMSAIVCGVAGFGLVRLARRIGWVDGGSGELKRSVAPVPLIGGAALWAGWCAGWAWMVWVGREELTFVPGRGLRELTLDWIGPGVDVWPFGGMLVALLVGTLDDVLEDGLRPLTKLFGQITAGVVLALPLVVASPERGEGWIALALFGLGAAIALNLVNTFDNADGVGAGVGLLGLASPAPWFAAAIAAFLPLNFARAARPPRAILGDAGSHLIGMAILITPAAWPVLALPCLDLARLSIQRLRLGVWPWDGDRRHLAHRLQARGWSPLRVALTLWLAIAPSASFGWLGVPLTAVAFFGLLRIAPAAVEPVALHGRARATG